MVADQGLGEHSGIVHPGVRKLVFTRLCEFKFKHL